MTSFDAKIVVIGAGIIGAGIAAELAKRGEKEVVVIEQKKGFGYQESGASAAMLMFNTHVNNPPLIKLAGAARKRYETFVQE